MSGRPTIRPAAMQDREVVQFDGRVLILRWMDPEVQGRYGTMVYVRCPPPRAPRGRSRSRQGGRQAGGEAQAGRQAEAPGEAGIRRPAPVQPPIRAAACPARADRSPTGRGIFVAGAALRMSRSARDFIDGPWRAVPVLGVTQILAWGAIFYTPVLIVPLIAAERGWSIAFAMGGFSVGLLTAGLVAPYVGRSIDRFGGHVTMTIGSLIGALGLALIVQAAHPVAYYAVWMVLGVAMAMSLYDSAFATLGRIFGVGARRPITALTLAGGFASTVSWPATHFLIESCRLARHLSRLCRAARRRRGAAACAGAAAQSRATPMCRCRARRAKAPAKVLPAHGLPFMLVASAFAAYAFVPSGLSAHLLAIFSAQRHRRRHGGVDRRAVRAGAGRRAADRIRLRPRPASAVRGARRAHRAAAAPSSCWRCSASRRRSPPLSR